ncbi:amidohydrolase/deacetylase family metallohydrolase [Catalinimonas niigatensis]|uniref:amidohydrolase/deacetylase family metallohydrolase n=1 Tax=Catalinimonas niigatensis TaxID=1397264 RepID=UPI002665016A|nr:amidohydrolase/deacetylase family metallohydrolase [Catalinimonas niigatensis]WPP51238.1 amidohydrolase/deacetylase family metallohydrolase [Catalinimonas niigatensis]
MRNLLVCILLIVPLFTQAQSIDLLIKGGHVFDPKNQIDGVMDVAIANDKILRVAVDIPASEAKKVIDATGLYVCPGLIDIHTHVFVGSKAGKFADGVNSLSPDDFTFRAGITTVVDAGTSGWRNFPQFKAQVIDQSKTRVLAFLNIAGSGMSGDSVQQDIQDMDAEKTAQVIQQYPDVIVGIKIGHYEGKEWTPFDRALSAGNQSGKPLFVECHLPQYSLEDQLNRMRPGDIITHAYEKVSERMSVIDEQGKVRPFVMEAQERGVLFDLGHGGAGFWFSEAMPALEQGLWPNSFGTDLHRFSMNAGMKDMLNVMSKYMSMGMPLEEVLLRASWNPAKSIQREDLGHLSEGAVADVAVLRLREGDFGYVDAGGNRLQGKHKLEAELTIRAGKVVWDLNGIAAQEFKK